MEPQSFKRAFDGLARLHFEVGLGQACRAQALHRRSGRGSRWKKTKLQPLYTALPKNEVGRLEPSVVRYALHRHFAQSLGGTCEP